MATALENLKSVNAYPIPRAVIEGAALNWGVDLKQELTRETMRSKDYNLCRAELLEWLASAPNISQGGQSYSFSEDQRKELRNQAQAIRSSYGEDKGANKTRYGYKGSRL